MMNNDFRQTRDAEFLAECRRRQSENQPSWVDRALRWCLILLFMLLAVRAGGWLLSPVIGLIDVLDQPAPAQMLSRR